MRRSRRQAVSLLTLGVLAGLGTRPRSAAAQSAAILLTAIPATPDLTVFYADSQGMFAKAGLHVTIQPVASGSVAQLAVIGGAAQIAASNTLSLAEAVAKGIPIVALAPGSEYTHDRPSTRLQVLPDSPLKSLADLAGKTVATSGLADLNAIGLRALIDKSGGDSSSIHFIEIPPSSMAAALEAHRVEAIISYDPFSSANAAKGWRSIALPLDGYAPRFISACYVAQTAWLQAHREEANTFARVIHDASLYVTAHYTELIPYVAQITKLPVATLQSLPPQTFPGGVYANLIQPVIDAAAKYQHFQPFPASRMIYDIPLNAAP